MIRPEIAAHGATLLSETTSLKKELAHVRIHVETDERVLTFSIIPISQVSLLDDMLMVCGALTNLCKSVVPRKEKD